MNIKKISAAERVKLARAQDRPTCRDYIEAIFDDFFPLAGDRNHGEDASILGGLALFRSRPVTVIGHQKGRDLQENMVYRFGMPNPEGYRKAIRLMKQAEKFRRPVITFIDTPGAYPGIEAEAGGQGEAIAQSIAVMSRLKVPTVAIFIGEGGSGGALALSVADRIVMLENSIFSILSPEGFASILWKDAKRWEEAAEVMKLTAEDLQSLGICDCVIPEKGDVFLHVAREIESSLAALEKIGGENLIKERYKWIRRIGKPTKKAEDLLWQELK